MDVVTGSQILTVTIMGAGGHGRDIAAIAQRCGYHVKFKDDDPTKGYPTCDPEPGDFHSLGVWEPRAREAMYRRLGRPSGVCLIHPSAIIGPDCYIGFGCVIGPGAILTNNVSLHEHVHVGAGAILTRCEVKGFSTISNGATVLGDVTIGSTVLIGGNAVVKNLKTVGDGAVVGMGSTVTRDIEANTVVAGNPAKTIGRLP